MEERIYNVTEFAKLCGVTPRTIKYYEELGLFCPEKVESNGYRVYNAGQMDEISAIRLFKEHGLSLKEIREIVACNDTDGMIRRLKRQQEILAERILHLNRQQRIVEESLFHLERAKEHGTEPFVEQFRPADSEKLAVGGTFDCQLSLAWNPKRCHTGRSGWEAEGDLSGDRGRGHPSGREMCDALLQYRTGCGKSGTSGTDKACGGRTFSGRRNLL